LSLNKPTCLPYLRAPLKIAPNRDVFPNGLRDNRALPPVA
jgi:hypothetical protein